MAEVWDKEKLEQLPSGTKRYAILEGRLHVEPEGLRYKLTRLITSTNDFGTARSRAIKYHRRGTNVVILDTKMAALIGNLWMISQELVK